MYCIHKQGIPEGSSNKDLTDVIKLSAISCDLHCLTMKSMCVNADVTMCEDNMCQMMSQCKDPVLLTEISCDQGMHV